MSPQGLLNKLKLILACEDPNYRIQLANSPNASGGLGGFERGRVNFDSGNEDRMGTKTNFWGINFEIPLGHSYSTMEDLQEARSNLKRWAEEWREKKAGEMELFTGKREISINEGETASTMSQSKHSNKAEKANALASEA